MGVTLLEELDTHVPRLLRNAQVDVALFITYTLNLSFFEQLVLPRLRRLGTGYIGILVDKRGYEATFEHPVGQEECGRSYIVGTPSSPTPLLHAKLLWLHGAEDIVYVGSHNLTTSGYNDQREVTARLVSSDPSHHAALRSAHEAVADLVSHSPHLAALWRRVPAPELNQVEPTVYFLTSQDRSLLDQLVEVAGGADELSVVTPYLDAGALLQLRDRLAAQKVDLLVPFEGTDVPLSDATDAVPGVVVRRAPADRPLHAKAYSLASAEQRWLALGSANCTNAGLTLSSSNGGNVEFLVLLPGGRLQDEELQFETVDDPSEMPGTGRRWDEAESSHRRLRIRGATYQAGTLVVEWESDVSEINDITLLVGDQRYDCTGARIQIDLEGPLASSMIELEAQVNGERLTARGWLVFPDELEAHAASRDAYRWREYLESDDPIRYAEGVDAYLSNLMRELLRSEGLTAPGYRSASSQSNRAIEQAIETFRYSSDPSEISLSINQLVTGDPATDPLAALSGLIARLRAKPPLTAERDQFELARHSQRRGRAFQTVADVLIRHVSRLTAPDLDWASTEGSRIVSCLEGSFEAIVLLWHKIVREISPTTRRRFAERLVNMMGTLMSHESVRAACNESKVAGPLVLVLGVAAEVIDDPEDEERVRRLAAELFGGQPEGAIHDWQQNDPEHFDRFAACSGGSAVVEAWLRPALRLVGVADPWLESRQEKWALLIELSRADAARDPAAEELYAQADELYRDEEVWIGYRADRAAGKRPVIRRVPGRVCTSCYQRLPDSWSRRLERGEAVICRCGAVLLFGEPTPH